MSETVVPKQRPKHLALHEIRLPLPGIVSILHRVSGAGLFLFLPVLLYFFGKSLESAEGFGTIAAHPLVKVILLGLLWAYLHHFCAGIRFLLLDMHKGLELQAARNSARIVLIVSLVLTVLIGVKLW